MELNAYVESLRTALAAAGGAAADDVRQAADRLAYAVEPSLRLTLLEALGDAAAEVTTQLEGVVVEVRLRGGDPELVATDDRVPPRPLPPSPPSPPDAPAPSDVDEGTSRVSLRLPDTLKARVEKAAAAAGVSVNTWLVRTVSHALDSPQTPTSSFVSGPGRRISGWVR
ncbi:MAG: hypothetical protein ACRDVZ_04140 [Jiangellaceae bacterium]